MGKAERNRRQSARERIAAQQAAARRAERRRQMLLAGGAVVAVIAVVVGLIVAKALSSKSPAGGSGTDATTLSAGVVSEITSVPVSTLNAVGPGSAAAFSPRSIVPIAGGPPLAAGGKPEVLYVGAEYCPYCATERWAMTVALSRFGTFSGLRFIHSSPSDVYPSTPTITYYGSHYTSKYLTFTPVETLTVSKKTLQNPTPAQQALVTKYDSPPYVTAANQGAIPFVDFANKYLLAGTQYNPQALQGQTWQQIAAALRNPSSPIAQGADGAANIFTAAICKVTSNQPASVCASPVISKIESGL